MGTHAYVKLSNDIQMAHQPAHTWRNAELHVAPSAGFATGATGAQTNKQNALIKHDEQIKKTTANTTVVIKSHLATSGNNKQKAFSKNVSKNSYKK